MSQMLLPSAVEVIWADTAVYADVGEALGNVALNGTPVIAPIPILKQSDADAQALAVGYRAASTDAYRGEGLASCDADSSTGHLVILLTDVGRGAILPSQLTAPEGDLPTRAPTQSVITVNALWVPRDQAYRIHSLAAVTADGDHQVNGANGDKAWSLLSTAGTVAGAARPVGLTALPDSVVDGQRQITSAGGARGYVMVGKAVEYD